MRSDFASVCAWPWPGRECLPPEEAQTIVAQAGALRLSCIKTADCPKTMQPCQTSPSNLDVDLCSALHGPWESAWSTLLGEDTCSSTYQDACACIMGLVLPTSPVRWMKPQACKWSICTSPKYSLQEHPCPGLSLLCRRCLLWPHTRALAFSLP